MVTRRSVLRSSLLTGVSLQTTLVHGVPQSSGIESALRKGFSGRLIAANAFEYETMRRPQIFGPRTDKRPLLIAECVTGNDIIRCLQFAQDNDLSISVRGGGHNFAGYSANAGGVLLDLRRMNQIDINSKAGVATLGAGSLSKSRPWPVPMGWRRCWRNVRWSASLGLRWAVG